MTHMTLDIILCKIEQMFLEARLFCSQSHISVKKRTYRTRSFSTRAALMLRRKSRSLRNSESPVTVICHSWHSHLPSSHLYVRLYHDVASCPSLRARSFCPSVPFFPPKYHSSTSSNWSADHGYRISRKKKISSIRRAISVRVVWSIRGSGILTWRDWSVGESAVQKARTREKRCEWTDRQMDRQADRKWNVLGGELNDVFEFGRYHPSGHPADERDERVCPPPFGISPGGSTCK